jgi:hypothetical protein
MLLDEIAAYRMPLIARDDRSFVDSHFAEVTQAVQAWSILSVGLFTPAADGSQWEVSTPHAWRQEKRAAGSFPWPAPDPAERGQPLASDIAHGNREPSYG